MTAASESPPLRRARAAPFLLGILLVTALSVATVRYAPLTDWGRDFIARRLDGLDLGRIGRLRVAGLRGDVWSAFSVSRLAIDDRAGAWLEARDVHLAWRPSALLERRLEIALVSSPDVTAWRTPRLSSERPPSGSRLPMAIQVDRASARVTLDPALAARRGVYDVVAAVRIDRSGAFRGSLDAASRLHAGDFLSARFDVGHKHRLAIDARALEARGGALAGALGLAADQTFSVDVHAKGQGKKGRFTVKTRVGATHPAEAEGSWDAAGGAASGHITLAASSRLAAYQAAIGPEARFSLTAKAATAGRYAMALTAESQNLTATARGEIDTDHARTGPNGVAIDGRVTDTARLVGWPGLGAGRLRAGLGGGPDHWVLAGAAALDRAGLADFQLSRLEGPFRIESRKGALVLQANARGAGGSGQSVLAAVLGANPTLGAELAWSSGRHMLIRKLSVDGAAVKVDAQGEQGLFGDLSFSGDATFNHLERARAGARGVVTATWNAKEERGGDHWSFGFSARGAGLSTGQPDVDRYLGAAPTATAKGDYAHGILSVGASSLTTSAGVLSAAGLIGPADALKLKLDWRAEGPLSLGPLDISGSARGTGALTGTVGTPKADLVADFKSVDAPYLPLHNAHMILSLLGEAAGPSGHITLTGASDYGPARGAAGFRFVAQGLDVSDLDVDAGGVIAKGSLALRDNVLSLADLDLRAGAGAFLEQGSESARLRIVDSGEGPRASLIIAATNAVPRDSGNLIRTLTVSAEGPLKRLSYNASGAGVMGETPWRFAGTGLFEHDARSDAISFAGAGRLLRADFKTSTPAKIVMTDNRMDANLHLNVGGGRADVVVSQEVGTLKVAAQLSELSLGLFNPDYLGRLDGTLALNGHDAVLAGSLNAQLTGVGGRDMRGTPPLDGHLLATLKGGEIDVGADLANAQGSKARIDVSLPALTAAAPFRFDLDRQHPISGRFNIDGEVRPLWDLTMGGGRSLAGRLRASGTLAGTLDNPRAIGAATLADGRFQDTDTGLRLEGVTLAASLNADAIDVSTLTAKDSGHGVLNGSGRVNLARDGASDFRLDLRGFRLIDNDVGQATATGQIAVNRAADGKVRLSGELNVDHAQLAPNPPVPSGVVPMDVVELHKPIDIDEPLPAPAAREAPVDLNIRMKAAGGVFIKGRGLNVELSLDALVGGSTADPRLSGVAHVIRGDYDFAGRRFQFDDRSFVTLGSTPETIRLDLTATREDPTLTAVIKITGTAAKPIVALSSTPVLPRDEVLSQVLFGTSTAQLNGLQAAQLASALSGLAGGGGFDVIGGLRNLAHLDRLAVSGDVATGTSVSGGKYLSDKVYLELSGGGREGPGAQVEWRVRRHLAIISKVTSQGDSQISVRWRRN